jgi:hypothetical protein
MSASDGCATIAGSAVSPITCGVDLCRVAGHVDESYVWPTMFVGRAIARPFIGRCIGVYYDMTAKEGLRGYARGCKQVFRQSQMVFDAQWSCRCHWPRSSAAEVDLHGAGFEPDEGAALGCAPGRAGIRPGQFVLAHDDAAFHSGRSAAVHDDDASLCAWVGSG